MKKISYAVLASLLLCSPVLHAEDKSDVSLSFWEKLRAKIEQVAPQKKLKATTAVGGVRGAKMAADDVYWKGEKVAPAVDADELEAFKQAMALVAAGEVQKAQAAFGEFVAKNPDSPLRPDAEQALAQLQAAK
jgi:TolA-binding protein